MDYKPLKIGNLTAKVPVIQGGMGIGISLGNLAGVQAPHEGAKEGSRQGAPADAHH